MMKFSGASRRLFGLLPCVGLTVLGVSNILADPPERTGADAPHHERNEAKNERKTALSVTDVNVPAFADTQKPVRKATAVKTSSNARKDKDKKKAEQQAREKAKADAAAEEAAIQQRQRSDYQVEDNIGSDAPHQERGADPNKRAARLFILER